MEATSSSETLVEFQPTELCHRTNFNYRCEDLKSYTIHSHGLVMQKF
jgi:hypothetical protein